MRSAAPGWPGSRGARGEGGRGDRRELLVVEASGRVRYGESSVVERPVRVEGQQAKFGPWTGFSWQSDESDRTRKKLDVLELALGHVAGRRFIHLARRKSDGVAMTEQIELLAWVE